MPADRLVRVLARLSSSGADGDAARLCEVSADVAEVSGAGITLLSGDEDQGSVCTSDRVSGVVDELQLTLGEGPSIDAYREDRPVLEPDLADPVEARWFAFAPPAVAAGVRAVFGFPLHVGAVRLGALNLYRDRLGPLSDDQHADALVLAGVAARAVLLMQAQAPPGALARELQARGDHQLVVHQASGMVAAQLEVDVGEALVRLRAHAFGNDRRLADVARDVVGRRLRFTPEADPDPNPDPDPLPGDESPVP
ncbi:MAG TPA: GAF and ANTAR domain-containing protein [Acidimicrobiales bacterium]|nr:GAF and ANTAR domain-containing protein [Acidimicrobiales bacterium]